MQIERIIREKGNDVACIHLDAPIEAAVAELRRWNVGALVVAGSDRPVAGIISERDIVRGLADDGEAVLSRPVRDLMSSEVVTCARDATVEDLMRLMTERRIRHVPVVDDGALVAIVSIGDVVKWRLGELEHETQALNEYITAGR